MIKDILEKYSDPKNILKEHNGKSIEDFFADICKEMLDNGYTFKEETEIYKSQLQDILDNTRWYLDSLDYLNAYRVSWHCYTNSKPGKTRIVLPKTPNEEEAL